MSFMSQPTYLLDQLDQLASIDRSAFLESKPSNPQHQNFLPFVCHAPYAQSAAGDRTAATPMGLLL
jgi:hypothetical protein